MDVPEDDYVYSLVANEDPWITYTLQDYEYDKLHIKEKNKCIYLPNVSELMLSSCHPIDVEDWAEASTEAPLENIITTTFDGVEYQVEEHFPYFCFVGAHIIAQLWRSRDPMSFNASYKDVRLDKIVPEHTQS